MKTLYIFRHGETDWNLAGRFQGGTNIPLNDTGREQAQQLANFFAAHPVEIFLSSDLDRAFTTARIAAGELSVAIETDARLRETNLGEAEGLKFDEIDTRFGAGTLAAWRSASAEGQDAASSFRFPNGESKAEHLARTLEALEEFLESRAYNVIGVASHGGSMRRLIHHVRPELTEAVMVRNCMVYKFTYEPGTRLWTVELDPVNIDKSRVV